MCRLVVLWFDMRPGYIEHKREGERGEPEGGLSVAETRVYRGLRECGQLLDVTDKQRKGKSEGFTICPVVSEDTHPLAALQ